MFYDFKKIEGVGNLFNILENCKGVEQMDLHHPEGDVFIHSVQCLQWAFRESKDIDLIFAAMLHDVGKQVDSKGHENYALQLLEGLISEKTAWLIKNHMRIWTLILGEMKKLKKVTDFIDHKWIPELVLLARWDKMARNPNKKINYDRMEIVDRLRGL